MDPDFEAEYADELEALQDLDDDIEQYATKSRKSLDFSTPSTQRSKRKTLDDSLYLPLDSPASKDKNDSRKFNGLRANNNSAKPVQNNNVNKRKGETLSAELSEDDDELNLQIDEPDLPDVAPVRKRQRMSSQPTPPQEDEIPSDFELTPPSSPTGRKQRSVRNGTTSPHERMRNFLSQQSSDDYELNRPRVLRRIPAGRFLPCTSTDGARVYMSMKGHEFLKRQMQESIATGQKSLQLLGTPLGVLKAQVDEERHRKELEEAQELLDRADRVGSSNSRDDSSDEESDETKPALWVERYAPRRYTELLSDESTNRLLLKWLKQWDYVVFDKEKKETKADKKQQGQKDKKFDNKLGKDGKPFKSNQPEVTDELDQHNRPMQKVSLLSGPPGLGKTTLAHIIARHAGYNVVEINASDDRSAELFKTKIEAATQMKAVLGADPRPNCLVIDEIDGAPAPAINMLIQMIKGPQENPNKKKKKQGSLLLRPIICICNDVYVPSLRQLRQLALHVKIPPTLSSKLASRLSDISRREKLKADMTSLLALCEKADNDIRSCLNTLQFIKGRLRELSLHSVQSLSLGQKDAHKSLFSVWQTIFKMPRPSRKRYVNPFERGSLQEVQQMQQAMQQNNTAPAARFHKILETAQASGEYDKIMQGLYENYLESKAKDPHMEGIQKACEWIGFADHIQLYTNRTQNYTLMRYLPYLPVTFHMYFASNTHPQIQYPQSQFEARTRTNRTENLISTLMCDVAPSVKKNLNITITVTEFLAPLTDIIQPSLRPVNTQLYSAREKSELNHLIHVMIAYNMTYHQERTPEGQYTYVLEPNIEDVVRFPGTKPQKQQLTYAAKQLIAREIDMEKMRKAEQSAKNAEPRSKGQKPGPGGEVPSHMRQTLTPKAITQVEDKPATDFFGRVLTKAAEKQVQKKKEEKKEVIGGDIWFRFKEGYTNAVRKTVRISDLV